MQTKKAADCAAAFYGLIRPAEPLPEDNIRNLHVQVGAYPQSHVPHSA